MGWILNGVFSRVYLTQMFFLHACWKYVVNFFILTDYKRILKSYFVNGSTVSDL
jgi:hypothetical protein